MRLVARGRYPVARGLPTLAAQGLSAIFHRDGTLSEARHCAPMLDLLYAAANDGTGRLARRCPSRRSGNTGTTQDSRDALFVGFAGDLVVGVWVATTMARSERSAAGLAQLHDLCGRGGRSPSFPRSSLARGSPAEAAAARRKNSTKPLRDIAATSRRFPSGARQCRAAAWSSCSIRAAAGSSACAAAASEDRGIPGRADRPPPPQRLMKLRQICAGTVPPLTFPSEPLSSRPTHTPTTRSPAKPTNKASRLSWVVPVLPKVGTANAARRPVPSFAAGVKQVEHRDARSRASSQRAAAVEEADSPRAPRGKPRAPTG